MVADGMTKSLPKGKFEGFVRQLGLQDIGQRLLAIKRMEELRDQIRPAQDVDRELKTGGRGITKQ